ncbi:MAG: helix-turn-helix domain-containing protein [Chloroflexota bacterium]|nr:helix-turn-helix domain-containing protein [Chloroflexota bacterium]
MTARDEAGLRERRLVDRDRAGATRSSIRAALERAVDPEPLPPPRLGELLLAARERKGVDLYRAERDTKIRAKYLAALERSEFKDLPGAVYTKGFLRNYALYLGLDPDTVLKQWKSEVGASRPPERAIVVPPPQPITAPRGGFKLTTGLFVAAVLAVGVLAFAAYIGYQLFRFAQPPVLSVDQPAVNLVNAEAFTLAGTSVPGATITIQAPGQQIRSKADGSGRWRETVPLNKGRNDFAITAVDPATAKESAPVSIIVNVPIPVGPEAPTLALTSPNEGTSFTNGAIPVQGKTSAKRVTVSAAYAGSVQPGRAAPGARPPTTPAQKEIKVRDDGSFSDSYQLAPGRWTLTISATSDQQKTTTEKRSVSVAFTGVTLVIDIRNSPAWLKVWVDGKLAEGYGGRIVDPGETAVFTAQRSVEVRTGSSGSTFFTLNGQRLGALGPSGTPQTWLFEPPAAPRETSRRS